MARINPRKIDEFISEAVLEGFHRGIDLFLEQVEDDLYRITKIEENGGLEELLSESFSGGSRRKGFLRKFLG
ncbi:MAG: hypothetical protein QXD03_03665 [Candidatus Anstonellales archaeon]